MYEALLSSQTTFSELFNLQKIQSDISQEGGGLAEVPDNIFWVIEFTKDPVWRFSAGGAGVSEKRHHDVFKSIFESSLIELYWVSKHEILGLKRTCNFSIRVVHAWVSHNLQLIFGLNLSPFLPEFSPTFLCQSSGKNAVNKLLP